MASRFECPRGKMIFEKSNLNHPKSKHKKYVAEHYFNHSVSVSICRNCEATQKLEVVDFVSMENHVAFKVAAFPIGKLLDRDFIEAFVKRGKLYMLSDCTQIDTNNCVAILPTGHVILSLDRVTYEEMGLEGIATKFNKLKRGQAERFVVTVDLCSASFVPGKKHYERVKWCFTNRFDMLFDFLAVWVPPNDEICPSSIGAYFSTTGYKCKEISVGTYSECSKVKVPFLCSNTFNGDSNWCNYAEFYEWFGAVLCNVKHLKNIDTFLSTFEAPEPNINHKLDHFKMTGIFSTELIQETLAKLQNFVTVEKNCTWVALTVHGFVDSPVSWEKREHGFDCNGDNLYTFVVFPNSDYWLFTVQGPHDVYF